jgi:lipoprotein-anchoring transpeptidase ErfK/SrfK
MLNHEFIRQNAAASGSCGENVQWYYLDGELFLETPITSGTMYNGWGTPAGVYFIYNRLQNVTLVGDDYRTPVNYWMQVNGGIGIHDSLWRYAYGGTEYLYNGSHGCINTPYNAVESLFWNIEVGVPVVIYY